MLFDLQSRGRKGAVKVIYVFLAVLMGGGLVLFGVGTGTGGGGLLDAFNGGSSSTSSQISTAEKKADREVKVNPQSPQAWADLARARYQTAGLGENYDTSTNAFTATGKKKLKTAVAAWQKYLDLDPKHPDPTLARLMAGAYAPTGLDQASDAASAMEIVTGAQPSASSYGQLAQYAYLALETRKGDLAAAKAVQLAPPAQRQVVKKQLANVKKQAIQQQVQDAVQNGQVQTTPSG